MRSRLLITCCVGLLLVITAIPVVTYATVPNQINYQGFLTDSDGTPVSDNDYSMTFKIYDGPTTVTPLWSETQTVTVTDGKYNIILGEITPIEPGYLDSDRYLGITVAPDTEMTPRLKFTSAAFSIKAGDADKLGGMDSSQYALITEMCDWSEISNRPAGLDDGDDVGVTTETDPTVPASIKDGISWSEVSSRPAGLDDGDDVGITTETDPQVGTNSMFHVPKWNGNALVEGSIFDDFGKIGIGTSTPYTWLEIAGPAAYNAGQLKITGTDTNSYISFYPESTYKMWFGHTGGKAIWGTSDGSNLIIKGGNLGIGTETPGQKLEVDGVISAFRNNSAGIIQVNDKRPDGAPWNLYSGSVGVGHFSINESAAYNVARLVIMAGGNVGVGTTDPVQKLTVRGNILVQSESTGTSVLELGEGLDYAEGFDVSNRENIDSGAVLIIDPHSPGKLTLSTKPYDSKVAGIVAGAKSLGSGVRLGAGQFDYDVALAGRVYCNVDTTYGEVSPGDLLTTSPNPGYAMKVKDYARAQGAILGKAMQRLENGRKGQILVLVTLQ